ncbi:hypothetical protein MMP71_11190 [Acinetobacter dispersus]|uniref:hypothetical protein n=1 Tax=Acinetobacter dispersus TaxID=70348 RepID=UPI001F4BA5CE|nr:hypothetical protein [Acinetobacter dispersus]MCH7384418.1 hypothetical protein [Acinetobacter dispersus]
MNSFFPSFEKSTIISAPYKYEPLIFFINSVKHLKSLSSGESQISITLDQCYKLLNKYISGKEVFEDDITNVREECKRLNVRGCRAEIQNTAKIIYDSVKFISTQDIILESIEFFILNNKEDRYGLLTDSAVQWQFIFSLLQQADLQEFVYPIFPKDAREQYFDSPIITFLPATWIPELITLPPSESLIFIHPKNSFINGVNTSIFKAPNNQSLDISTDGLQLKQSKLISITSSQEFYSKFSAFYSDDMVGNSDVTSITHCEQPLLNVEFFDYQQEVKVIECNKEYLVIDRDGKIKYSTFENNDQIQNIKYIVDRIDTSCLTSEDLKRKQNYILEKWKKPLRDHLHIEILIKELEKRGAIKAKAVNIKYWSRPETIAPLSYEDYKAVLLYAGITDKYEIERFFEFARKRRGDSISEGHDKKIIGLEIVREFLESLKIDALLKSEYQIQGIKFSLIALG